MYEAIDRYVLSLVEGSTPEKTLWNIERLRAGKPTSWNYMILLIHKKRNLKFPIFL